MPAGAEVADALAFPDGVAGGGPSRDRPAVTVSDSPGFLLNQAVLTLNGSLDRALAPTLTGAQWTVVYLLHQRRAYTASELARVVGTDVTACWRLVGRLTEKDYVARAADRTDRRVVRLRLTPTAVERYPAWRAVVAATVARLLDGVATADLPVLNRALVRIVSNGAAAPAIPQALAATPPRPRPSAADGDEGGRR